jgi:hypothetical protein
MTGMGFSGPDIYYDWSDLVFEIAARWDRWLAAVLGLAGVMVVVGPQLSGSGGLYHLLMLASSPVFAASFLLTKVLTRYDRPEVIVVWQSITVTLFSLPMALIVWKDLSLLQWFWFLVCGALGSAGHYCLTRSFGVSDISSTQSVKFLDLVWASLLGWLIFADVPASATLSRCARDSWFNHLACTARVQARLEGITKARQPVQHRRRDRFAQKSDEDALKAA